MFRLYFMIPDYIKNAFQIKEFLKIYGIKSPIESNLEEIFQIWNQLCFDNISRGLYACYQREYLSSEDEFNKYCEYLKKTEEIHSQLIN